MKVKSLKETFEKFNVLDSTEIVIVDEHGVRRTSWFVDYSEYGNVLILEQGKEFEDENNE